jgi:hypothetical protein
VRAAVCSINIDRIVEHFDWKAGSLGGFLRQYDGTRAGIEDHRDPRAIHMCGKCEVAAMTSHHFDVSPVSCHVTGYQLGNHTVCNVAELKAVAVTNYKQQADHSPKESGLDCFRKAFAKQGQHNGAGKNHEDNLERQRADIVPQ